MRQINKQQNVQRSIYLNKYIDKAYNDSDISQNVLSDFSPVKKLTPIELVEKLQQQKKREPPKQLLIASHQTHVIKDADIDPIQNKVLFGLGNSMQDKKQRRKELIKLYKQKRELNTTEQATHQLKQSNVD